MKAHISITSKYKYRIIIVTDALADGFILIRHHRNGWSSARQPARLESEMLSSNKIQRNGHAPDGTETPMRCRFFRMVIWEEFDGGRLGCRSSLSLVSSLVRTAVICYFTLIVCGGLVAKFGVNLQG